MSLAPDFAYDPLMLPALLGVLILAGIYLGLPLRIRSRHSIKAHSHPQLVELDQLPPDVAAQLVQVQEALLPHGFTAAATLRHDRVVNLVGCISLLVHANRIDYVRIAVIETTPRTNVRRRVICFAGFSRDYDGEASISTSNREDSSLHPRAPGLNAVSIPQARDPVVLWRIHCARVQRLSSTIRAAPKYVEEVQAIKHFEEKERRTIQRAIDGGYYRLDEQKDRYRLTLKGTYLLTWKLLPPFKQIRLRLNARKARVEMSLIPPALLQSPKTPPPPLAAVRTGPA